MNGILQSLMARLGPRPGMGGAQPGFPSPPMSFASQGMVPGGAPPQAPMPVMPGPGGGAGYGMGNLMAPIPSAPPGAMGIPMQFAGSPPQMAAPMPPASGGGVRPSMPMPPRGRMPMRRR